MPNLNGNWVDLIILIALGYFISEAWRHGLWIILADFGAFFGSLLISLRGYKFVSGFIGSNFSLPQSISNALGFLVTAIVVEAVLGLLFGLLIKSLPKKFLKAWFSRALAIIPAFGQGLILVAFFLTLILNLPVKPVVKDSIADSKIGGAIVERTSTVEKLVREVFGEAIDDSLTYLTVKPGSRESIPLTVEKQELAVDEKSETAMFALVNKERRDRGIAELVWAQDIVPVARNHARDMWERSYFGHVSPEGKDVGNRLEEDGISFFVAGENLALAPTLTTAHTGLMNSQGHKENILEGKFKKIGIGVIDNGYSGKMFVQVFTD